MFMLKKQLSPSILRSPTIAVTTSDSAQISFGGWRRDRLYAILALVFGFVLTANGTQFSYTVTIIPGIDVGNAVNARGQVAGYTTVNPDTGDQHAVLSGP